MIEKKYIKISPSILGGDFGKLADEAKRAEDAGADWLHLDIMDGHFVPNLTMGPRAVAAINRATDLFLDTHLMIYNPKDYIERFAEAGSDLITFHFEAAEDIEETLQLIRKYKTKAGLAFCPETSVSMIPKYLDKCDLILLMTVHPGFGGQDFMPEVLDKIRFTRELCDQLQIRENGVVAKPGSNEEELPPFNIQVDGGINPQTAKECVEAGANILVAGTYVFGAKDINAAIHSLRVSDD